jgi:hypothetical protein
MSTDEDIIYIDEDIPEIDYYELVSIDEIIKNNPSFIAFSKEEIYNELFNFLKTKNKTECFLNLFYEIVNKKTNVNNFIVVADATRGEFEDSSIDEFIVELKKYDKLQPSLALKSKSKLWFPLSYDKDNSKLRFTATQKTTIELSENNNYIVFKDDETNLPIIGVYFYTPAYINDDDLSEKIMADKREKLDLLQSTDFTSFDDLIKNYKLPLPLDKIDEEDYNYSSINNLLQKYNYNLDNISSDDLNIIRIHLEKLNQNEKEVERRFKPVQIKPIEMVNPRYTFFNILQDIRGLLDESLRVKRMDKSELTKIAVQNNEFTRSLNEIISKIDNSNYDVIIKTLKDIRRNISIDNISQLYTNFDALNKERIIVRLNDLEIKFELLKFTFSDIYKFNFTFKNEEHELEIGGDEKRYEGIPTKIGNFNNNDVGDDYDNIDEDVDLFEDKEFNKYYNNYYYKLEHGFIELLKFVLPFINKLERISNLPLNYDVLVGHLFNKYRVIDSRATIIKKHIQDIDDAEIENINKKSIITILLNQSENKDVRKATREYFDNLMNVIFDIVAYWSIYIQNEVLQETLFFNPEKCSPECIHLWDDHGAPYDMNAKVGILHYITCVFKEVYGDIFKDQFYNIIPMKDDYKELIIKYVTTDYKDDLEKMAKFKIKHNKQNKGREFYELLKQFLDTKDYKNDKFFKAYIDALVYMPSVKFVKIHKYLQGCCLEKIDDNFSADLYLRTERKDLKKAKEKFSGKRVFNEPRAKRFFLKKEIEDKVVEEYIPIKGHYEYDIIDISVRDWLANLNKDSKKTIFTKQLIDAIVASSYKAAENYKDAYINYFNSKDLKNLLHNYQFNNYKQIILIVSKILFSYLNSDATDYIAIITNTLNELDKLNSIINDENIKDIINIRRIAVLRVMALPSSFENAVNKTFIPTQDKISREVFDVINKEIVKSVISIIKNSKMFNFEEQVDFINIIREKNKFDILAKMNKKTRDEKDIEKELKKYGLKIKEDVEDIDYEENKPNVNTNLLPNSNEIDGENEYDLRNEDEIDDDEFMDRQDYGFIYAD